uniref:Uncharacterized protein n=2 Tax=Plectus sambesii TaxID=2011161 RepID=A0A914UY02_9BILA
AAEHAGNESTTVPSGMSKEGFDRVRTLSVNKDEMKSRVLQLLASSANLFSETEALELVIIGLANSAHFVVSAAEALWKKIDLPECLKDKQLMMKLFLLYSGNKNAKDVPVEQQKNPAGLQLRLKIFPALIRSQIAPLMFPKNIQVTFDALFGGEGSALKLQLLAVEFLGHMISKCPDSLLPTFGPILFSGTRKIIETCEHARVVATAYQSFGVIGKRCPQLISKDMALVQESFDAIPTAPDEVAGAIVDCLTTWLPVFSSVRDVSTRTILQALIGTYVAHDSPKCRLVSLKYIEALLQSPDVESRWMLCNAYGDSREDIRKEALRLLQLSLSVSSYVPPFALVVKYFADKLFSQGRSKITNDTMHMCTRFAFACLTVQAGRPAQLDLAADEAYLEWFAPVGQLLSKLCAEDAELIPAFLKIALSAIESSPDAHLFDIAILTVTAGGEVGRSEMAPRLERIRDIVQSSSRHDLCSAAAQLFSVSLSREQVSTQLLELHRQLTATDKEHAVGSAWLCGYLTTRPECDRALIAQAQACLARFAIADRPSAFTEAACGALAESLRRNPILLTDVLEFIDQMGKIAASRKESIKPKLKEAALAALGYSSRLDTPDDVFQRSLTALFSVGEGPPQAELQFNVGDALFDAIVGECSPARRNVYTETVEDFTLRSAALHDRTCLRMTSTLRVILDEKLTSTNWHLRQAALIWLFVLMKRGGHWHPAIKENLDQLQEAFIDGLAETNELSQDVASKGMGLVYETGNVEQKQTMVAALVDSLTTGRKLKPRITDDTTVFEKGALGKTPGGETLSTYRELCALATDLNQPDLMYKFMQLASHNALWNSKKGAAFGFSVVLNQAKEQLEPHLGSLVPKLFRYRYDPDQKVQSSMRAIWQALAGSRKGVIDEFADKIFSELVPGLTHAQWRVRESSCLALSDLLSGHSTPTMIEHLGDLFEHLFRVQDDVKESVRLAANRCMNTVINVTLKHSNSERGEKATATIGIVLPILIEKGMKSVVKANRMVGLGAVISMAKEAGAALKPHLAFLIPCLLESLSETEPTVLNYLAARSTGEQLEALDTARASAAKTSPMMTALYDCVPHVDATVMRELGPRLGELLRSGIGLSTRTGACQFLITVCLRCQRDLLECRPVCDKLLQSLSNGLKDRNVTIRKQYASAIGYLAKYTSDSLIEKLLLKVKTDYVNQEVDAEVAAGFLLRGLANNNLELLKDYCGEVVPLIMMAKSTELPADGSGREMADIWEEIWAELVPGSEGAVRLYRQEIVSFALEILSTSSVWAMKANAAKVLQSVAELGGKQMDPAAADQLYDALVKALVGRTWDGKERVLMAITQLIRSCVDQLKASWNASVLGQKFAPLLKECERPKLEYKAEALLCAAAFCEQLRYGAGADQLVEVIKSLLSKNADQDSDSDGEKDRQKVSDKLKERQRFETAVANALGYVGVGIERESTMNTAIDLLTSVLETAYWKVKQTAAVSLRRIFEKWSLTQPFRADSAFISLANTLLGATQTVLADDCVKALQALVQHVIDGNPTLSSDDPRIRQLVRELLSAEACQQSPSFSDILSRLQL